MPDNPPPRTPMLFEFIFAYTSPLSLSLSSGLREYVLLMEEIKGCLLTITNPKDAKEGELSHALKRLDELVGDTDSALDPKMRHYLQNRSYQKALLWIEGGSPEKGTCGK